MPFDLQDSGWPTDQARREFRRVRATILAGLFKLAGAEAVPESTTQDRSRELSGEGRRRLLAAALGDLQGALTRLADLIRRTPPAIPDGMGGPAALERAVAAALEGARDQLGVVDGVEPEDLDRLVAVPEAARPPLSDLINTWCPVRKVFVAVHGIGDQFQNETVQSVAHRVCDYVGVPAALPLGRFHGTGGTVTRAFIPDPDRDPPIRCGFAEIYWANVPRIPAADKHILEEPKKWARTLVERLRLRDAGASAPAAGAAAERDEQLRHEDDRIEQLIGALIQGVIVTDRIATLADKAGLFKFDLKQLLDDYLNDVQVVTEFEDYRRQLLEIFEDAIEKLHRYLEKSEIYIIAHSEGTVVSFMGLLKGLAERAPWAGSIRGYMTIGSPLNKHLFFWPELFDGYDSDAVDPALLPIPWKNYYDYGDPIAFNLKPTRDWMRRTNWNRYFAFRDERGEDDIGFTRYYFPGAAHNDYWDDGDVFGHFIEEVADRTSAVLPRAGGKRHGVPGSRLLAWLTSYPLPYVLAAVLLFLACYLIYKPVRGCLDPIGARFETPGQVLENVLGLFGLIAGMSLLARIPRLARAPGWRILAFVLFALFTSLYLRIFPENRYSIERFVSQVSGTDPYTNDYNLCLFWALVAGVVLAFLVRGLKPVLLTLLPVLLLVLALRVVDAVASGVVPASGLLDRPGLGPWLAAVPWRALEVIAVAGLVGFMAWRVSWAYPAVGTKPLIHTGGLLILMIVITQFVFRPPGLADADRNLLYQGLERGDRVAIVRVVDDRVRDAFWRLTDVAWDPEVEPGGHDPALRLEADRRAVGHAAEMHVVADAALEQGPIWPVFLAGAAFLYIWWLAVLLFDLTFVWHLYIRWSGAEHYVRERIARAGPVP